MKEAEVIATLEFYEKLTEQLTDEAIEIALQSKALGYQLRASINSIERKRKKRWWRR